MKGGSRSNCELAARFTIVSQLQKISFTSHQSTASTNVCEWHTDLGDVLGEIFLGYAGKCRFYRLRRKDNTPTPDGEVGTGIGKTSWCVVLVLGILDLIAFTLS